MNCWHCGFGLDIDDKFCSECGKPLESYVQNIDPPVEGPISSEKQNSVSMLQKFKGLEKSAKIPAILLITWFSIVGLLMAIISFLYTDTLALSLIIVGFHSVVVYTLISFHDQLRIVTVIGLIFALLIPGLLHDLFFYGIYYSFNTFSLYTVIDYLIQISTVVKIITILLFVLYPPFTTQFKLSEEKRRQQLIARREALGYYSNRRKRQYVSGPPVSSSIQRGFDNTTRINPRIHKATKVKQEQTPIFASLAIPIDYIKTRSVFSRIYRILKFDKYTALEITRRKELDPEGIFLVAFTVIASTFLRGHAVLTDYHSNISKDSYSYYYWFNIPDYPFIGTEFGLYAYLFFDFAFFCGLIILLIELITFVSFDSDTMPFKKGNFTQLRFIYYLFSLLLVIELIEYILVSLGMPYYKNFIYIFVVVVIFYVTYYVKYLFEQSYIACLTTTVLSASAMLLVRQIFWTVFGELFFYW